MLEIHRILDANFNRAREALRVIEDCGRFALNDPAMTVMAKTLRSNLKEVLQSMPIEQMIASRDTPGDIGTELSSPSEPVRTGLGDVAVAACKRLTEALRTIEEYAKVVSPTETLTIERMRYDAYTLEQRLTSRLMVADWFEKIKLYLLIGPDCGAASVRDTARQAIAGGAEVIQLRDRMASDAELLAMAAELRELTDETGRMFIVNDRADIAAVVGADGLHLGQHDLPIADARRLLRPGAIIGKSTHSLVQARAAVNEGADYIAVGPIFPTTTKYDAEEPIGLDLVERLAEKVTIPIVAIGGINAENVSQVVAAGAQRVAVCSAICCADDPKAAAQAIHARLP